LKISIIEKDVSEISIIKPLWEGLRNYSVSTISKQGDGEIDSLFLLTPYRHQGIGDTLMCKTLKWFDEAGVSNIRISVSWLNEGAVRFYKKYKFEPSTIILKLQ
jgi:diamine N-acetyltransferase